MTLRAVLLTFRMARFETTLIVGATVLSLLVSAIVIGWWNLGGYVRCATDEQVAVSAFCQASIAPWLERIARASTGLIPIFPVIAGLLAGGPIVARELESGTARLAWSLGPARLRWFGQRVVPMFILVACTALAIGLIADPLIHLNQPSIPLDTSFFAFRGRGLLIAVEAVLMASVALAIGALVGRAAPTLVFSLVLVTGIGFAVDKVERSVLMQEAVIGDESAFSDDNLYLDGRLQMPDGSILTWEQLDAQYPELAQNGWDESSGIKNVNLYIPGSRYHDVERREALAQGLAALAFLVLSAVVVVRRRPR